MEYHPEFDPAYEQPTRAEKIAREGISRIKDQLKANEWVVERTDDASYRAYSRGSLRVRLTVTPLEAISFESLKSNRHLNLDMDVAFRKELYDLFINYNPKPETQDSRREDDSAEWLDCLHENRFGRSVWRVLT